MTTTEQTKQVLEGALTTQVDVAGSGPPLVYFAAEESWNGDPLFTSLAESFTVYSPKLCLSEESLHEMHGLLDLMNYVNDVLDALELTRVPVVGHSWGGMVATELAAINQDRVEKLVLLAPLGLWKEEEPVSDLHTTPPDILAARLYGSADVEPATTWLSGATGMGSMERLRSMRSALHFLFPIPERGLKRRIRRVVAPTLVIWGEKDGIISPSYAEDFQRAIAGAQVRKLPSVAHMLLDEQADEVAGIIRDFVTS